MRLLAQRAAGEENFASFSLFSGFLRHFFDTTHAKGPRTCASLREKWGPRQNHVLENRLFEPPLQLRLPIAKSRRHERTHATTSACKVRSRAAMARQGWAVQQQGQHGERLKAAAQERRTCTVSTMIEKRKKPQQGHQHVRDSSPRRTTNCQPVSRSPVWLAAHAAQMPQLTIEADSVAKHEALHACGENEGGGSDGSRKSCCCGSSAECGSPWPHNCQRRRSDLGEGEGGDEGGEAMVGRGHGRGQHASRASGLNGQGGKLEGARGEVYTRR